MIIRAHPRGLAHDCHSRNIFFNQKAKATIAAISDNRPNIIKAFCVFEIFAGTSTFTL